MNPIALILALAAPIAVAQRPEYAIREDRPRAGSIIRQSLAGPVVVPVNLPYERLSAADRRKFNENYESIAEGDEPPFPKEGLQAVLAPITRAQQRLLSEGELFLVATVSSSGKVTEVRAHGTPSPEITKFAAQVLLLTPFKSAICSGRPCVMEFPLRMKFETRW